jgi:hypothetical protein
MEPVVLPPPRRKSGKSWARLVTSLDASLDGGWMFEGPWLERGDVAPVAPGDLVLLFDGWDTRSGPRIEASLHRVGPGGLELLQASRDRGWAGELARAASGLVPSEGVTRRALEEEIRRAKRHLRGLEERLEALP